MLTLSSLALYPVKSVAGVGVAQARVEPAGLAGDRRWMLVDPEGRFVTGRQLPALVRIHLQVDADGTLTLPNGRRVASPAGGQSRSVTIWRDTVAAIEPDPVASAWFSQQLGRPLHLVCGDPAAPRTVRGPGAQAGDVVSFADGYPLLLISDASLADLSARVGRPVEMARFRPNLTVAGGTPFQEDAWTQVDIGGVRFELAKTCTRCVFTTVDPLTGERSADGEPLHTLKSYRRSGDGVIFGMNLIPRGTGELRVGDPVRPC
ncbi:MAG: MOSC domain-containing protein [Xanthomonadales bacterium]|jgi:hypothetical protein|nr:MOSC domain-containing protein [Xanthomonadales bacterium]